MANQTKKIGELADNEFAITGNEIIPIETNGKTRRDRIYDLITNSPADSRYSLAGHTHAPQSARALITSNITFYVSSSGNNSNDGLSQGAPLLTIQEAIDRAVSYDLGTHDITIQIANGTYTTNQTLKSIIGAGTITITGNASNPENVLINPGTGDAFQAPWVRGTWNISNLKIAATSGAAVYSKANSLVRLNNIDFGQCSRHMLAHQGGIIEIAGNYKVSGGATNHMTIWDGGIIQANGITVTFSTNTTNFSDAYLYANTGVAIVGGCTFINKNYVTGKQFTIELNAVANGASASYLPGTVAGTTASGGQLLTW